MVHTLRQLFPPAPHGTERSRCKTQQRQATNNNELPSLLQGGGGGFRKKREQKARERETDRESWELTVKARASSPELSVGSPVSGYHAV